jgi:ATP-dependent protease Clp ATPase subunit
MITEQQTIYNEMDRIVKIFSTSECHIRPHFILTGPSGSGKSHLIQQLAEANDIGYLEINAAQLTKEGTSGNSLSKALAPLASRSSVPTLVFVDEFDKLFISGNSNNSAAHEVTHGVQNEFLRVLESKTASVFGDYGKYIDVSVDNVLFVFAGAFNGEENITVDRLREIGIKTEFLGRVGITFSLQKLSVNSMYYALSNSKLLDNYITLFPDADRDRVIKEIMEVVAAEHEKNTLGIRLLNTLLHQYFINGGKLRKEEVKATTFQKHLSLGAMQ